MATSRQHFDAHLDVLRAISAGSLIRNFYLIDGQCSTPALATTIPKRHSQAALSPVRATAVTRSPAHSRSLLPTWPIVSGGPPRNTPGNNRVNAKEHLTRPQLGNFYLFVTQHLRATELVQPFIVVVGILFSFHRRCATYSLAVLRLLDQRSNCQAYV